MWGSIWGGFPARNLQRGKKQKESKNKLKKPLHSYIAFNQKHFVSSNRPLNFTTFKQTIKVTVKVIVKRQNKWHAR